MTIEMAKECGYEQICEVNDITYWSNLWAGPNSSRGKVGYLICFSKEGEMISMILIEKTIVDALFKNFYEGGTNHERP